MQKSVAVIAIAFLLLSTSVFADMGPKPKADIYVSYSGQDISGLFQAKMLTCGNQPINLNCSDINDYPSFYSNVYSRDIESGMKVCEKLYNLSVNDTAKGCYWSPAAMAWGGTCSVSICNFYYFLPESFRLAVYLPSMDRTFVTNEILRSSFNSVYSANLLPDGSGVIVETTPLVQNDTLKMLLFSLLITLIIEVLVGYAFTRTKNYKRILISIVVANLISLPILWTAVMYVSSLRSQTSAYLEALLVSEILVMVFEACFIFLLNKKTLTFKRSLVMSIVMNIASLVVGGVILIVASLFSIMI